MGLAVLGRASQSKAVRLWVFWAGFGVHDFPPPPCPIRGALASGVGGRGKQDIRRSWNEIQDLTLTADSF